MAKIIFNSNEKFKFNGKYSLIAAAFAMDSMRFLGCDFKQASRFGNSFMADWGNMQKEWRRKNQDVEGVEAKISQPNKDGEITTTDIDKVIRIGLAKPSISIAGVLQHFEKARKSGISCEGTTLKLIENLDSWLFQTGDWTPIKEKEEVKTDVPALEQVEA